MMRPLVAALMLFGFGLQAMAQPSIRGEEWQAYRERFITNEGRVVDDGNNGISHSEGQGYGMLLAFLAGQAADFDQLWSFTRTELLLRNDGLAAWKWEPHATPRVTDPNNAADGDMLIAYALGLAGEQWQRDDLLAAGTSLTRALGRTSLYEYRKVMLLRPGVNGFSRDERPDGPVVNPSYWVFEAFPTLARLDASHDWARLGRSGVALLQHSGFGPRNLPPDWLALGGELKPAEGFAAEFGYNALRIPLYLVRSGANRPDLLRALRDGMTLADGTMTTIDLATGEARAMLADAGYRIIPALLDCALDATPVPDELKIFEPTSYYPSTLHLLALSHLREEAPQCLG